MTTWITVTSILENNGIAIKDVQNTSYVDFYLGDNVCRFWLKKQWLTGKPVRDGRGLNHLENEIKEYKNGRR